MIEVDMRAHEGVREQVRAGVALLRYQGRQIWGGNHRLNLDRVVVRLMVGVGDLARLARGQIDGICTTADENRELKKELGNIIFSTIRWIDDLGLDPLECLDLAIEAQEKFAQSGRPR